MMIRYALRALRSRPAFTLGAVATVAVTVGATTAIFSVVYGVLLRQLPYHGVDRVFWIWSDQPGRDRTPFNVPDFIDYRDSAATVSFAGYFASAANSSDAPPERLQGLRATANFFEVLGARAQLGRLFQREDERQGFDRVVVLTERLWRRRFAADPAVVGRTVRFDAETYTVIGVLTSGFATPIRDVDFVLLFRPDVDARRAARNSISFIHGVGRLREQVSAAQASDEFNRIARRLQAQYPVANARKRAVRFVALIDGITGSVRTALLTLFAAVTAVLLIACANLANLMLTRATARKKEFAVQLALGAARGAIVRYVLIEAVAIAVAGGVLGIVLAQGGVAALTALAPADLPRAADVRVDRTVLAFSLALATATGLLFGVVPAVATAGIDIQQALHASGRGASSAGRRTRGFLAGAEVALAVLLLIVMAMLARSFVNVQRVQPGFDPSGALSARLTLPANRYSSRAAVATFEHALRERLSSVSAVTQAGAVSLVPLSGLLARVPFTVDGRPVERERVPLAQFRLASPGYFDAAGIAITIGRGFADTDTAASRPVAIVNEALAQQWLAGLDPLASRLFIDDNDRGPRPVEIVGVAANVRQLALDGGPTWDIYLPYAQLHPDTAALAAGNMFWIVRAKGDPMNVSAVFTRAVHGLDPDVVASQVQPMGRYLADATAPRRFSLSMVTAFGLAALVLALTGVYAVIAYSVEQRRREFGIRLALGATPGAVASLVIADGLRFVLPGVAAGGACAAVGVRLVSSLLFGVTARDPSTYGEVMALVTVLAVIACIVPTRRLGSSLAAALRAE